MAVTRTWTGAVNGLWSEAGNWNGGVPSAGDTLVFPPGASNLVNTNDLPAGTVFNSLLLYGQTYVIGGNPIGLSGGISGAGGYSNTIDLDIQLTTSQTFGGLSGLTLNGNVGLQDYRLTMAGGINDVINGVISGTGGLDITVSSDLSLTGANTYTGATIVSNSTLRVDGIQPGSNVTGPFYFTLTGRGTVGDVAMLGRLSPGGGSDATGILTLGNLSLGSEITGASFFVYEAQINGPTAGTDYDQLRVIGTVTLADFRTALSVSLPTSFAPSVGQTFVLVDNDGVDPVVGAFSGYPEGSIVSASGHEFWISYAGGTGNDIVLTCKRSAPIWTGAVNGFWSEAGNWSSGVPVSGDTLVFPPGASNLVNTNDLPAGMAFDSLLLSGQNYFIGGNAIGLSGGINGSGGFSNTLNLDIQLNASQTFSSLFLFTFNGDIDLQDHRLTVVEGNLITFAGGISGTGGVSYGSVFGTVLLTGTNSYSGSTIITNAGVQIDGSQENSSISGLLSFTLRGHGIAGDVAMLGTLAPGGSAGDPIGILTIGSLSLGSEITGVSRFVYEVQIAGSTPGTDYDQLRVHGTVALDDLRTSLSVGLASGFAPAVGQTFLLLDNDGADAITGTFAGLPEGAILSANGYEFRISYAGGTGNDIVLTRRGGSLLEALSPAEVWIGLANSDDVGIRFDLIAQVYVQLPSASASPSLIGWGRLDSVAGGSSGFGNAKLNAIPLTLDTAVVMESGGTLSIKLLVRNACTGSGKNSGRARLWFNDSAANSRFDTTIDGASSDWFLRDGYTLAGTPGPGPKKTIDAQAGSKCSAFKPFGTWTTTIP